MDHPRQPAEAFLRHITRDTLALILAGGRGTRLGALTQDRVKPAVPFGGAFRLIDFPLSNCVNSGIRRIGLLTQYKSHSLIQHVQKGWSFFRAELGEFIELLPAQQRRGEEWYRGTADAVYQNADIVRQHDPQFVLVLGGDHIYKMDYGAMLGMHVATQAEVTVACMPVPLAAASAFGVMQVDADNRVVAFAEKPAAPVPMPDDPGRALASMGIYVFDAERLLEMVERDAADPRSGHDFGKDILPAAVAAGRTFGFPFRDARDGGPAYWRDVGTLDSFWEANLELLQVQPELNLYDEDWPIWTYQEQEPPAKFVFDGDGVRGSAVSSMVAGGCIVAGATVRDSLLFAGVRVEPGTLIESSVILPGTRIGRGCTIRRAVIDAHAVVPDGVQVGVDPVADAARFEVSPRGVVLATPDMLERLAHAA